MTETDELETLLRGYWRAEEARDVDAILQFWNEDGEFVDRFGKSIRGADALRTFYNASAQAFPRVAVRLVKIVGGMAGAGVQYEATLWDRDEEEHTVRVALMVECRDGRFSRIDSFFDGAALVRSHD
jgi:hypothetical protein